MASWVSDGDVSGSASGCCFKSPVGICDARTMSSPSESSLSSHVFALVEDTLFKWLTFLTLTVPFDSTVLWLLIPFDPKPYRRLSRRGIPTC